MTPSLRCSNEKFREISNNRRMRLLLVEDDIYIQDFLRGSLEEAG